MIAIKGEKGISEAEVLINTSGKFQTTIVVATNDDKSYITEIAKIMEVAIPEVLTIRKLKKIHKPGSVRKPVLMYNLEKCLSEYFNITIPVCTIAADTKGIAPYNGTNLDIKPGEVKEQD